MQKKGPRKVAAGGSTCLDNIENDARCQKDYDPAVQTFVIHCEYCGRVVQLAAYGTHDYHKHTHFQRRGPVAVDGKILNPLRRSICLLQSSNRLCDYFCTFRFNVKYSTFQPHTVLSSNRLCDYFCTFRFNVKYSTFQPHPVLSSNRLCDYFCTFRFNAKYSTFQPHPVLGSRQSQGAN
jgi:hypothetical protein